MDTLVKRDLQVAPFRKLDDFILEKDRFKLPDFSNLPKWNDRINGNLIYYQTNYFIGIVILFVLIGLCSPGKLLFGLFSIGVGVASLIYLAMNKPAVNQFQSEHPAVTVTGIFILGYSLVYVFDCVLIFLLATLFPVLLMLIHASTRQRGVKNKIAEKMDSLGLKKTPMGLFLDYLGQELDKIE